MTTRYNSLTKVKVSKALSDFMRLNEYGCDDTTTYKTIMRFVSCYTLLAGLRKIDRNDFSINDEIRAAFNIPDSVNSINLNTTMDFGTPLKGCSKLTMNDYILSALQRDVKVDPSCIENVDLYSKLMQSFSETIYQPRALQTKWLNAKFPIEVLLTN